MTDEPAFTIERADHPLIATAIHEGHSVRDALGPFLDLSEAARLREEDPGTGAWTAVAPTRIVGSRSRFEVDLNRRREAAVYLTPKDAWGLKVWNRPLPPDEIEQSIQLFDEFHASMIGLVSDLVERHAKVVVFDLHSYNHRRGGPQAELDDPELNPEVNIGTGTLADRTPWAPVIDRFIKDLREFEFLGRHLDVRENVKFKGGELGRRLHEHFPRSVCVLSIEFKKFFMDEWTGEGFAAEMAAIQQALQSTVPGVLTGIGAR